MGRFPPPALRTRIIDFPPERKLPFVGEWDLCFIGKSCGVFCTQSNISLTSIKVQTRQCLAKMCVLMAGSDGVEKCLGKQGRDL